MTYKKGDKIKVIDDNLSGVVISVKENEVVIETDFGFEMTYQPDEILPDIPLDEDIIIEEKVAIEPKIKTESTSRKKIEKVFNLRKQETENKSQKIRVQKKRKKSRKPPLEIDLHYGQLENYDRLLAKNLILKRQITSLKKSIERARENGFDRVVIIHGKGEGVLEAEVKKWLNEMGYFFYDADFNRYKLGATEVELPKL